MQNLALLSTILTIAIAGLISCVRADVQRNARPLVSLAANGSLIYSPANPRGDTMPDFSNVGYKGGVAVPDAPVRAIVAPDNGGKDDLARSARLQAALDQVAALPLNAQGIRGALLVKKGRYLLGGTLKTRASGVVLRGEGDGGCNREQIATSSDTATPGAKRYKIGFATLTEDIPFAVRVREGIQKVAKDAGNVDLVIADNKLDSATALANADNFITQGVDGVIEFQADENFGKSIMDKMNAKKIPVIAIDIPMPDATFFGVDNPRAGQMAGKGLGEWIKKNWGGKVDNLIMLELPQSGPTTAARMKGERDGLESVIGKIPKNKVKHLDSKDTLEEARTGFGHADDVAKGQTYRHRLHQRRHRSGRDRRGAGGGPQRSYRRCGCRWQRPGPGRDSQNGQSANRFDGFVSRKVWREIDSRVDQSD